MLLPSIIAVVLAASPALAQETTKSLCWTGYGFSPATTSIRTYFLFSTTTSTVHVNVTTRSTVTVIPSATTFTDIAVTTTTISTTKTSIPPAVTIPTAESFLPLLAVAQTPVITLDDPIFDLPAVTPTGGPIVNRFARHLHYKVAKPQELDKRQGETPANNQGGYIIDSNGIPSNLTRTFPRRVRCNVNVVTTTISTSTITASPTTVTAPQVVATLHTTSTVSTTTTFVFRPEPKTVYAACQANNVADRITDRDGHTLIFNEVAFRRDGFPIANELKSTQESGTDCCVQCQKQRGCAGAFFYSNYRECHLRFIGPAPTNANSTLPAVCEKGSGTLYLGRIYGQTSQPKNYSLTFSNGPCGRFSWSPAEHNHAGHKRAKIGM